MAISSEFGAPSTSRMRNSHRGMAFLVEALVVLAFLMTSLAVFVQLFSSAQLQGMRATRLSEAVMAATNTAEQFSANPTGIQPSTTENGLTITCAVEEEPHTSGKLYNATITVRDGETELYTLRTARYVSANGGRR